MFHRARIAEASQDIGSNQSVNETIGDIIQQRLGRRDFLKGTTAIAGAFGLTLTEWAKAEANRQESKRRACAFSSSHLLTDTRGNGGS